MTSLPGESEGSSFPDNPDFPDSAFAEDNSPDSSSSSSSDNDSDREWTKNQRGGEPPSREYNYKRLAELRDGDKKQNVICVVKEFKPPAPTRGLDYYSLLTLVDESDPRVGVRTLLFNRNTDKLPQVKREGDIVCIHRIGVKNFNYQTQLEGGGYCSIIRFSGEIRKKIKPCTGSLNYSLSSVERDRVRVLRKWARKQRMELQLRTLQSVQPNMYFDLLCQTVSVTISKFPRCIVLSVWDGTPHMLRCRTINLEKNYDEGYPEVRDDPELSESSMGYSVDIVIYSKRCMQKVANLQPGKILYLKNLHCAIVDRGTNTIEMCIYKKNDACYEGITSSSGETSRITILNRGDGLCRNVERQIEKANTPITSTPHCNQPFCTVADITSYGHTFPAKFRCRARVLAVNASCLEDLVVVHCSLCQQIQAVSRDAEMNTNGTCSEPCSRCSSSDRGESLSSSPLPSCQFYFKMTLGDASGEIMVKVGHQQAVDLFGGFRPNNFYQYQQLRFQLNDLLYSVAGGMNPFAAGSGGNGGGGDDDGGGSGGGGADDERRFFGARPWVECCILAVQHDETVHYCLFDTILKQT